MKAPLLWPAKAGLQARTSILAAVSWLLGAAFASIPIGASAATVSVPPPAYYAYAGSMGGFWSDSPTGVHFNGPPVGALAQSYAGAAAANFVASAKDVAVDTGLITAEMRYFLKAVGTSGEPVLMHVEFAGYAYTKTALFGTATSVAAYASASAEVNGHLTIFCASDPLDGCPSSPPPSNPAPVGSDPRTLSYDTTSFYAIAGEDYVVDLLATVHGGSWL
jgi:hypothetical protein